MGRIYLHFIVMRWQTDEQIKIRNSNNDSAFSLRLKLSNGVLQRNYMDHTNCRMKIDYHS